MPERPCPPGYEWDPATDRCVERIGDVSPSRRFSSLVEALQRTVVDQGVHSAEAKKIAQDIVEHIGRAPKRQALRRFSFRWAPPLPQEALDLRLVKMVATHAGATQDAGTNLSPRWVFTEPDMVRAARTLADKPIDIDHLLNPFPIIRFFPEIADAYREKWGIDVTQYAGWVLDAEEEDGNVEAIGMLDTPEAFRLAVDGHYVGASVVSWARMTRCSDAGEKSECVEEGVRFYGVTLCLESEPAFSKTWVRPILLGDPEVRIERSEVSAVAVPLGTKALLVYATRSRRSEPSRRTVALVSASPTALMEREPVVLNDLCDHSSLIRSLPDPSSVSSTHVGRQSYAHIFLLVKAQTEHCPHRTILDNWSLSGDISQIPAQWFRQFVSYIRDNLSLPAEQAASSGLRGGEENRGEM